MKFVLQLRRKTLNRLYKLVVLWIKMVKKIKLMARRQKKTKKSRKQKKLRLMRRTKLKLMVDKLKTIENRMVKKLIFQGWKNSDLSKNS